MVPSEKLRSLLEIEYNLPLSKYAWDDELKSVIYSIPLDKDIEDQVAFLGEAYEFGFNLGHCRTTSRYFSINFQDALMHFGVLDILKGTKKSTNGGHAWVEMGGYILDPSLMIVLPLELKDEFGYHTERILAKESSMMLSEYDTFSQEKAFMTSDPSGYNNSMFTFNHDIQR